VVGGKYQNIKKKIKKKRNFFFISNKKGKPAMVMGGNS